MAATKNVLVTGMNQYRIIEPYTEMTDKDVRFTLQNNLKNAWDYDAVVLQIPIAEGINDFIRDYQKNGKKVIIDIDDNVFLMHPENPEYGKTKDLLKLRESLYLCDYIHCSTPQLLAALNHHKKSIVLYNGINFKKYGESPKEIIRANLNIPPQNKVVMWAGSTSHYESVLLIVPLIKELCKVSEVSVVLCGNTEWLQSYFTDENIIYVDFQPFEAYTNILSIADVALVPLPNNGYSRCKSELKVLENAAYKTPCVASMVDPYVRFKSRSGNGVRLVPKERVSLWLREVELLLINKDVYRTIAECAYSTTKEHYNLETINKERMLWWKKILN